MFGWLDRLAGAIYQRGRSLTEVNDRVSEEKRIALRGVSEAIRDAMTYAEQEREHGRDEDRDKAMAAAQRANATAREIDDDEARNLVIAWRRLFDAIPKFHKKAWDGGMGYPAHPAGYPEPAWSELKAAADTAQERLGELLRELMKGK